MAYKVKLTVEDHVEDGVLTLTTEDIGLARRAAKLAKANDIPFLVTREAGEKEVNFKNL